MPRGSELRTLRAVGSGLAAVACALLPSCGTRSSSPDLPAVVIGASGADLFAHEFTPDHGLGPLYNATSCGGCHRNPTVGGSGVDEKQVVFRVATIDSHGNFDDLTGRGGPIARNHTVAELGYGCALRPGVPALANAVSTRDTPPLFGLGLVETIADDVILAGIADRGDGIAGHVNWVDEGAGRRVGRFGWKAQTVTLLAFASNALRNELGINTPDFPNDLLSGAGAEACAGFHRGPEIDGRSVALIRDYIASLPPVAPDATADFKQGRDVFERVGCTGCHSPTLAAPSGPVPLYSDLLLHDMGPSLRDGFVAGDAKERDWRTTPLWGLRYRKRYTHDARTTDIGEAILAHAGEAEAVLKRYSALAPDDGAALLAFLRAL